MANVFQDGYYIIANVVFQNEEDGVDAEYEVIVDGPYITESAARDNKDLNGGHSWIEYLTFENFEMVTDGDLR